MAKDEKNTANKDVFVRDDIIVNKEYFEKQLKEKESEVRQKDIKIQALIKEKNHELKRNKKLTNSDICLCQVGYTGYYDR